MRYLVSVLIGATGLAALAGAAPAAAQYYPNYPSYGYGYGSPYAGGVDNQAAVNQCAAAAQGRLGGGYGGYGYNGYGYGGGRVLGISRVEPRPNGLVVRGVATSGRNAAYAYGGQSPVDLTWRCSVDYRGFVTGLRFEPAQRNYGYSNDTPSDFDVSQYGYVRY